jgi:hypothetical protein
MDPNDLLTTLAQLGVTIAGFSGIVVALGSRARGEWSERDWRLLAALLETSGAVVLWSLLPMLLLAAELPAPRVWLLSSASWALGYIAILARDARKIAQNPRRDADRGLILLVYVTVGGALVLQAVNLLWMRVAWPHLAALTLLLALSFVAFLQLLQHEASPR